MLHYAKAVKNYTISYCNREFLRRKDTKKPASTFVLTLDIDAQTV